MEGLLWRKRPSATGTERPSQREGCPGGALPPGCTFSLNEMAPGTAGEGSCDPPFPKMGTFEGRRGWSQAPLPAPAAATASTPDGQRCPAGRSLGEGVLGRALGGTEQRPPMQYQPPGCSSTRTPGGRGLGLIAQSSSWLESGKGVAVGRQRAALSPGRAELALPNCPQQRGLGHSEERREQEQPPLSLHSSHAWCCAMHVSYIIVALVSTGLF